MAELIGVVASVVGIVAAAGKVAELISNGAPGLTELQPNAKALAVEVASLRFVLGSLQKLVLNPSVIPETRRGMVQFDELVVLLTTGVHAFSDLEALVSKLGPPTCEFSSRLRWGRKEKELGYLLVQLSSFRANITVMLNVLQCDADVDATRSQKELSSKVEELLRSNRILAERMERLERVSMRVEDDPSSATSIDSDRTIRIYSDLSCNEAICAVGVDSGDTGPNFTFRKELEMSRPYRKLRKDLDSIDFSFRSSITRAHAWTILSSTNISIISVVALPIALHEISNPHHYLSVREDYESDDSSEQHANGDRPSTRSSTLGESSLTSQVAKKVLQIGGFGGFSQLSNRRIALSADEADAMACHKPEDRDFGGKWTMQSLKSSHMSPCGICSAFNVEITTCAYCSETFCQKCLRAHCRHFISIR